MFKQRQQERLASSEFDYYRAESARMDTVVQEGDALSHLIKKRLLDSGRSPVIKKKGELHIFLAYSLTNWEYVLPIALKPFGRVTEFESVSRGFDHNDGNWLEIRDVMNRTMLDSFYRANSEEPIDVVVGYLSGYKVSPEVLNSMGKAGAVITNFNWDDKLKFKGDMLGGRWSGTVPLAGVVDLNLTNVPDSRIKYMVEGGPAMFWPEAAHPAIHKRYDLPFEYDVSFIGGKYGCRPGFIKRLRGMSINVACFGNGWENGPMSDEEMVKLYSKSRINLGFAGVGHSLKLMCLKGRDFEVPMSGGLYLTQDNPELSLVYDVGKEIMTYKNEKDCAEKIKWILTNPEEADEIRKAGKIRALKDHTWEKRFGDVFRMIGLI